MSSVLTGKGSYYSLSHLILVLQLWRFFFSKENLVKTVSLSPQLPLKAGNLQKSGGLGPAAASLQIRATWASQLGSFYITRGSVSLLGGMRSPV